MRGLFLFPDQCVCTCVHIYVRMCVFPDQCACMGVDMCVLLRQSVGVFMGQWEVIGRYSHPCSLVLKNASDDVLFFFDGIKL